MTEQKRNLLSCTLSKGKFDVAVSRYDVWMEKGSGPSTGGGDVCKTGLDRPHPETGRPIHHKERGSRECRISQQRATNTEPAYFLRRDVTGIMYTLGKLPRCGAHAKPGRELGPTAGGKSRKQDDSRDATQKHNYCVYKTFIKVKH